MTRNRSFSQEQGREFLKDTVRQHVDFSATDQNKGIAPPPLEKPCASSEKQIPLPGRKELKKIGGISVGEAFSRRRSRRNFTKKMLTLDELAFLLWTTQGVQRRFGDMATFRPVPSAGGRHALETYLCVLNVEGLEQGIYRYLPVEHALVSVHKDPEIGSALVYAALGQSFVGGSAVTFIWTAIPYRMEWRYGEASYKVLAIDAGHVCQNLYLACEAIRAGTCAIAAYNQELIDALLKVDGKEEFTVYLAPVGKV